MNAHTIRRVPLLAVLFGSTFAMPVERLAGQDAPERLPATLFGKVVNSSSGLPVEGAVVSLLGSGYGAITDSTGNFRIPQTWAGPDTIEVRFIGFEPSRTTVELVPNEITRITLLLSQTVVRVADLVVEIKQTRRSRNLEGFVERMRRGFGDFFTPRDIINRNPRLPSDLLRGIPNVTVSRIRYGKAQVTIGRGARLGCPPAIYLDGVYQAGIDLDDIPAEELGAVELYKGMTDTPMQFMRSASTCGAIVIWTPDTIDFQDWAGDLPDPFDKDK
ncbi:MAG: TonB-dependent receptor [Gemmatimonadota bacterium]